MDVPYAAMCKLREILDDGFQNTPGLVPSAKLFFATEQEYAVIEAAKRWARASCTADAAGMGEALARLLAEIAKLKVT